MSLTVEKIVKSYIPTIFTIFTGGVIVANKFFKQDAIIYWSNSAKSWSSMVMAIATFVGLYGLIKINSMSILKKPTVRNIIVTGSLFVSFILTIIMASVYGSASATYVKFSEYFYGSINRAVFSLYFFAAASAGYRGLRFSLKRKMFLNIESLLLFAGVFIMMGSFSPMLSYYFPWLIPLNTLLLNTIARAGESGASICIGAAALVYGIRMLSNTEVVTKRKV
jgi:hypothetical protein